MTHVEALAAHLQKGEALLVTTAHDRRYLTGMKAHRHPYASGVAARRGIEY